MTISGTPSRAISTRVGVAKLVRGEAAPHAGSCGDAPELRPCGG
jgi:hypothetical protein